MGDVTITTNSLNKQINSGNLPPAEHDKLSIHKFNRLDAPSCFLSRQRERALQIGRAYRKAHYTGSQVLFHLLPGQGMSLQSPYLRRAGKCSLKLYLNSELF